MIGVEGQYVFRFKIGDRDDFINEEDLHIFKLHEEAGNVLPTFLLSFDTIDDSVMKLIHEGNDLEVSFGRDLNSLQDISLVVTSVAPIRSGDSKRNISVTGLMSKLPYISTDRVSISDSKSGIEVLKEITSRYFNTTNFNITKSIDKMYWVQSSLTDRQFINQLWMHSDVPDSFIACGISSDGNFILKDIKKDLKTKFKWRFTNDQVEKNDIGFDGDFVINLNSGFINHWVGYPREKLIYDLEAGTESKIMETATPITALTTEISRRADIEKRYAVAGVQNENVHANFWQAYLRNLTNLGVLGSVGLILSFGNRFEKIRVLDQVMFKEDDVATPKGESSEFLSGIYFVSSVTRILQNRQFATTVKIARESFNQLKGDSLARTPTATSTTIAQTPEEELLAELQTSFPGRF
jgi:hypothetical protein